MKKLSLVAALLFSIGNSYAADLDKGIFELNRGQFIKAIAEFEPLVEQEYAPAQYQMALIYQNGWGKRKDPAKAFELMTLSAEQNYVDALFALSVMYSEGKVVPQDLSKAFTLMKKAAEEELASAQFNVAVMYANGEGVAKNSAQAVKWYEKAARQSYVLAQFNLALMHYEGQGVEKSIEQSYIWNYVAAKSGYVPAKKSLEMDVRKLPQEEVKEITEKAEALYKQIQDQIKLKVRAAEASSLY